MTDLTARLNALDAKRRAATPGRRVLKPARTLAHLHAECGPMLGSLPYCSPRTKADAAYIAALDPGTVGALIDVARAAEKYDGVAGQWGAVKKSLARLASRLGGKE